MTKFNKEIQDQILGAIADGMNFQDACMLVGISEKTFGRWRKKAEKAKSGEWFDFHLAWKKAEMENKKKHILKINESKDWKSSSYTLQNRYPNEYSDKTKVEASVEHKGLKGLADALKD